MRPIRRLRVRPTVPKVAALTAAAAGAITFLSGFVAAPLASADQLGSRTDRPVGGDPAQYDGHKVVRVFIENEVALRNMYMISDDSWSCHEHIGGWMDFRLAPDQFDRFENLGIDGFTLIPDVGALIRAEQAELIAQGPAPAFDPANPLIQPMGEPAVDPWYEAYRRYTDIYTRLDQLELAYPDIVESSEIGRSIENRPIRAYKITAPGGGPKPQIVYHGTQHAREWISPMVTTYIAEALITGYGVDPYITSLVDNVEWHIVPVSNPDGYEYAWNSERLWRKNRRNNGNGTFGVDLNRNWGYQWGGQGSSGNTGSDTYRGTAPFSEPETQALRNLMQGLGNVRGHIDFHSYSQLILFPWNYTTALCPDHDYFTVVAGGMEDRVEALYGTDYFPGPGGSSLYLSAGCSPDWTYGELGALGFTVELRDTGFYGFILPADQIVPSCEETLPMALFLGEVVQVGLLFEAVPGLPDFIEAGLNTPIDVSIQEAPGVNLNDSSVRLFTRTTPGGSFTSTEMIPLGGDVFRGSLPATTCGNEVDYYFQAATVGGVVSTWPADAPASFFTAQAFELDVRFGDNFETDLGWTVTNTAVTDGAWGRAVPNQGGTRGDPPSDFDGSGRCYVTGPGASADLDGGPTVLTSPAIDLSNVGDGEVYLSFARWMSNDDGDDAFVTELSSNNGQTWVEANRVVGGSGGWNVVQIIVGDYVALTNQVRVRFVVSDNPNNSVTEAGVDAVEFLVASCQGGGTDYVLEVGTLTAGQKGDFQVSGATPSTGTYLVYSLTGVGSTFVSQLNVTLDLNRPTQAGDRVVTDNSGNASWSLTIPLAAGGRTIWFQSAQFENKSNVVNKVVQN